MGIVSQLLAYSGSDFMHDLLWLTVILVSIAGAFMTLYAVYIGFLFMTATDAGKRSAAKTRLMKVLGSALIIYAMVAVLTVINVTFSEVETSKSGNDVDNLEKPDVTGYKLENDPTLTFTVRASNKDEGYVIVDGDFSIKPDDVVTTDDGTKANYSGAILLKNIVITGPEQFPKENTEDHRFNVLPDENGTLAVRFIHTERKTLKYAMPCCKNDKGYYLTAVAEFEFTATKTTCTAPFNLYLKCTSAPNGVFAWRVVSRG